MPLHIKDDAAIQAVRRLARARNLTLAEAVRAACLEALARDEHVRPVAERLADIHAPVRSLRRTGDKADEAEPRPAHLLYVGEDFAQTDVYDDIRSPDMGRRADPRRRRRCAAQVCAVVP